MAGSSGPEGAVDSIVARAQSTLDCILNATILGSGNSEGFDHSLPFYAIGQTHPNSARLATHGGTGEIRIRMEQLSRVVRGPEASGRQACRAEVTF